MPQRSVSARQRWPASEAMTVAANEVLGGCVLNEMTSKIVPGLLSALQAGLCAATGCAARLFPTTEEDTKLLYTAETDPELRPWLRHNLSSESPFIRALVGAAKLASPGEYTALQPVLRRFRASDPEPDSSLRTLVADAYRVVFNEQKEIDNLDVAFTRFNASVFDNTFPETKIRYASSIVSQQEPGWPIGLFAEPDDPVSRRVPGQFRLDVPHIFISEKLRGIDPIDEWVLLHEMCHHKVPNHGPDFIAQIKQALDATGWRTLIGGF